MKRVITLWMLLLPMVAAISTTEARPRVRNVIYLIGDGFGLAHLSMMEVEQEFRPSAFERAEAVSLIATRSANNRVTDSAAAGTALATGVKINNAALGVTPDGVELTTMMEMARDRGMATGMVVTCYLQHATPAAFYANTPDRGDNKTITDQLVECRFEVLMGGGARWMQEKHFARLAQQDYLVVRTLEEAERATHTPLFALLDDEYLPEADQRGDYLPRATHCALELLSQDRDGFLLMVEGSQIDGMSHARDAVRTLAEVRDFERAVKVAMDFADAHPGTLVVVTSDHETGGLALPSGKSDFTLSESGIRYRFASNSHTAVRVPAWFYGTGADRFDPMMENTELAEQLMQLLRLKR